MTLEQSVSQAVFAARLLEDLVHRPTGWTLKWGPFEVPARVIPCGSGVQVEGSFPDVCYLARPTSPLLLKFEGEVRSVRDIEHPGDGGFDVQVEIAAQTAFVA